MPNKTAAALREECDRFLSVYDPTSLPRVAMRNMGPIIECLKTLIHELDAQGVEIHAYPVASRAGVPAVCLQHVYVSLEGKFLTMLSSMPVEGEKGQIFMWSRPPVERSMEDLVELGLTPYEIVQHIKEASTGLEVLSDTKGKDDGVVVNMPPASA